jgi:hypothetical protein
VPAIGVYSQDDKWLFWRFPPHNVSDFQCFIVLLLSLVCCLPEVHRNSYAALLCCPCPAQDMLRYDCSNQGWGNRRVPSFTYVGFLLYKIFLPG